MKKRTTEEHVAPGFTDSERIRREDEQRTKEHTRTLHRHTTLIVEQGQPLEQGTIIMTDPADHLRANASTASMNDAHASYLRKSEVELALANVHRRQAELGDTSAEGTPSSASNKRPRNDVMTPSPMLMTTARRNSQPPADDKDDDPHWCESFVAVATNITIDAIFLMVSVAAIACVVLCIIVMAQRDVPWDSLTTAALCVALFLAIYGIVGFVVGFSQSRPAAVVHFFLTLLACAALLTFGIGVLSWYDEANALFSDWATDTISAHWDIMGPFTQRQLNCCGLERNELPNADCPIGAVASCIDVLSDRQTVFLYPSVALSFCLIVVLFLLTLMALSIAYVYSSAERGRKEQSSDDIESSAGSPLHPRRAPYEDHGPETVVYGDTVRPSSSAAVVPGYA